ncbi:MAG: tetratricopeptide repeat protein [Candidatus Sabulitectum sp.]|nr:tetratricopeptide repeat protein [Candidatus Sabulitectum sp.]
MDREIEINADHLLLEEVMITDIDGINAPDNWSGIAGNDTPDSPPVVIQENRGFSLVGNHRAVWQLRSTGKIMVKCLVVRNVVHVKPAHMLINNCTEEAMLFEGLLRLEIVPNRSRLAEMLGYSRARITQLLNQLKLPMNIRQRVLVTDELSEFKLRPLLKFLDDPDKLQAGFKKLMEKKLSGRQMAIFTNSDMFINGSPGPESSGSEETNKVSAVSHNEPSNSVSELEDVFSADEPDTSTQSGETPADTDTDPKSAPDTKPQQTDMARVLRELGSVREDGWRIRAAEYMLSPLEMEFLTGVSKLRTGLYTEAMDILGEVVSEDSSHHLAWFYLGRCSNLTGNLQEAEEYLRNAVSRRSNNPDYLVELAIVLEKLKRHSEAEAFYRRSARIRKELALAK